MEHWGERRAMGQAAYETVRDMWNADHAAKELLRFSNELLRGMALPAQEGPLSMAPAISPGEMYRVMMDKEQRQKLR